MDSSVKAVTTSTEFPAMRAKGDLKINGSVTIETEAASGVSYDGNVIFEVKTCLLYTSPEGKLNMVCKPNEEKTLLLTYSVIKKNFHEQDWVNIDQRNFDLVLSVYPEKGLIHLY